VKTVQVQVVVFVDFKFPDFVFVFVKVLVELLHRFIELVVVKRRIGSIETIEVLAVL
jgi:hypothetical protein